MWHIIFFIINIFLFIIAYFIIVNRIEKKVINRKVIDKIKEEVNAIIIGLNEATLNNVTILDDKLKILNKRINLASKKMSGLKVNEDKEADFEESLLKDKLGIKEDFNSMLTYSPKKVVNQSKKITEELINKRIEDKISDDELFDNNKNLNQGEKAVFLFKKGWSIKEIQNKIGLTSGEIELLINMENINR